MRPSRRTTRLLIAAVLVALLLLSRGAHLALIRVLGAAQAVAVDHPTAAAALVVVFAAVAAMLAFVSSWVIVPFAIFTWGTTEALVLLWSGWLLGGMTSYALGRFVGRPAIRWLAQPAALARYEHRITPHSAFGLVLLLQLGLPSEIPGYLLGLVRYSFPWYLLSLGMAELLHGVATIYLGSQLLQRRTAPMIAAAAALALITAVAAYGLRRRLVPAAAESRRVTPSDSLAGSPAP